MDNGDYIDQILAEALGGDDTQGDNKPEDDAIHIILKEKVLTVSATEYCNCHSKDIKTFDMVGVFGHPENLSVPKNTEVVVGYNGNYTSASIYQGCGTALVRKDDTDLNQAIEGMKNG